ncbi:SAC3/GANP/THP3 conserved domain-containing protein [Entamoeba marina]
MEEGGNSPQFASRRNNSKPRQQSNRHEFQGERRPKQYDADGQKGSKTRYNNPRGENTKGYVPRDENTRGYIPRGYRIGKSSNRKPRDDRSRDERPRDDRSRDERPRDERPRDERPRDERPRRFKPRGERTKRETYKQRINKIIETCETTKIKPKREDLSDVIKEVEEVLNDTNPDELCEEMCGPHDVLEYLYNKNFYSFELDEENIPDPLKIVKPYKRRTGGREEKKCDIRTLDALWGSFEFIAHVLDESSEDLDLDSRFSYVVDRIRAIHGDIIQEEYLSVETFDLLRSVIQLLALYSFYINEDNYDLCLEQLKQWLLTMHIKTKRVDDDIRNEEELNEILEFYEQDSLNVVMILSNTQLQSFLRTNDYEVYNKVISVKTALDSLEYSRLPELLKDFPKTLQNVVFHALFRRQLITMRHKVLNVWAKTIQRSVSLQFLKDSLLYDSIEDAKADLISCGITVKDDDTFIPKPFRFDDVKRIPRNKSNVMIKQLEDERTAELGEGTKWSDVIVGGEEEEEEGSEE